MLRSRGEKSLDLQGLQDAKQAKQGKDTFSLKIHVLPRNKSTAKELMKLTKLLEKEFIPLTLDSLSFGTIFAIATEDAGC